jgi:hypothetical protein
LGEERFGTEPQITHEVVMSLRSPRENENGGVSRILLGPPFPLMGVGIGVREPEPIKPLTRTLVLPRQGKELWC